MSFALTLVKLANGDMLQYFQDHPEKLKEKLERDCRKKEKRAQEVVSDRVLSTMVEKTAQVKPYQQSTQWTCSAACLKSVLDHYGIEVPEQLCVRVIGTRKGRGAECNEIMWGAHKLGFDSCEYSFDSLEQARTLTDQDIPIIADVQSFNNPGKGHYVVITRIEDGVVHLMDPNTPGNERHLSFEEMEDRWWDHSMQAPHTLMMKWGVIVLPPDTLS